MKRTLTLTVICLLTLWLAGLSPLKAQQSPAKLQLAWKFDSGAKITGTAEVAGDTVYFGNADGTVYALDANDGTTLWSHKTEGRIASRPLRYKGLLYVLSGDGHLYALDAGDGSVRWAFKTGGEHYFRRHTLDGGSFADLWDYYLSSPVVAGGLLYFGSSDGHVYALQADNGALKWKFKTGGEVHAAPVFHKGTIYVGSFDGFFYALDALTGTQRWKFDTTGAPYFPAGAVQRAALVNGKTVYFGSRDYRLYALNIANGHERWKYFEKGSWVIAQPLLFGGHLYFGTSDTHLFYRMNAHNGLVDWEVRLPMRVYGTALPAGGRIYAGCFDGVLYGFNPRDGSVEYTFRTDGSHQNKGRIYAANGKFRKDFQLYGASLKQTTQSEMAIQSLGSIMASPVLHGNLMLFGTTDHKFYAVKLPFQ